MYTKSSLNLVKIYYTGCKILVWSSLQQENLEKERLQVRMNPQMGLRYSFISNHCCFFLVATSPQWPECFLPDHTLICLHNTLTEMAITVTVLCQGG